MKRSRNNNDVNILFLIVLLESLVNLAGQVCDTRVVCRDDDFPALLLALLHLWWVSVVSTCAHLGRLDSSCWVP